jgi:hypothetical protein
VNGDFGAASRDLFGVVGCTVEGAWAGALRTLTSGVGSTIVERLESLNDALLQLSYALLTGAPIRNCLTTMAVPVLRPNWALNWNGGQPSSPTAPGKRACGSAAGSAGRAAMALKEFLERNGTAT